MSHISSPVKKIADLSFDKFPSQPVNVTKIVYGEYARTALTPSGRILTNLFKSPTHMLTGYVSHGIYRLLKNLVKLKVITQAQMDEHCNYCDLEYARKALADDARRHQKEIGSLGLGLTAADRAHMDRLADVSIMGHPKKPDTPRIKELVKAKAAEYRKERKGW